MHYTATYNEVIVIPCRVTIMKLLILFIIFSYVFTIEARIHPEIQYLFPIPNTDYHAKESQLIIRFKMINPSQIRNINSFINIEGEKSGEVAGKTIVSSDHRTIIFIEYGSKYLSNVSRTVPLEGLLIFPRPLIST